MGAEGGLKNDPRGTGTADELLHRTPEENDAEFPQKTGADESWHQGESGNVSRVEESGDWSCCKRQTLGVHEIEKPFAVSLRKTTPLGTCGG
jgi:hypothetical protein